MKKPYPIAVKVGSAGAESESELVSHQTVAIRIAVLILLLALGASLASSPVGAEDAVPSPGTMSININTASAEDLAAGLNGIGLTRAQDIVRHREAFGPFASVEELNEIRGIGQATIDKNRAVITLE